MLDTKQLREEFSTLQAAAQTLIDKAGDEKRDFTAEEKATSDNQFKRMGEIKSILDRQAQLAGMAFASNAPNVQTPAAPEGQAAAAAAEIKVADLDRSNFAAVLAAVGGRKAYAKHVNDWMRTGQVDQRFATITGSTAGGILMPTDVVAPQTPVALNVFREALAAYGMEAWKTPSTRNVNLPLFTSAAGSTVSGTATTETEQEPGLTESIASIITTYHSGNVWFENRDLDALDFDLLSATVPAMSYSKELALESAAISAVVADAGITQSVTTTTAGGLAFTYADFVALNRILPKRYQANKVIVLSKSAYAAAENMTTTTGFPLLNQDAQNQQLKRFNGCPVVFSEFLPAMGPSATVGIVFSWLGAKLRDAGEGDILQRFTQTANRQGQTGCDLYGYHSFGYSPLAVAKFVTHA